MAARLVFPNQQTRRWTQDLHTRHQEKIMNVHTHIGRSKLGNVLWMLLRYAKWRRCKACTRQCSIGTHLSSQSQGPSNTAVSAVYTAAKIWCLFILDLHIILTPHDEGETVLDADIPICSGSWTAPRICVKEGLHKIELTSMRILYTPFPLGRHDTKKRAALGKWQSSIFG